MPDSNIGLGKLDIRRMSDKDFALAYFVQSTARPYPSRPSMIRCGEIFPFAVRLPAEPYRG